MAEIKQCKKCGELKPASREYFHYHKTNRDRLSNICKGCLQKQNAKRYAKSEFSQRKKERAKLAEQGLKRCTNCKEIKPMTTEYFGKSSKDKYGWKSKCLDCRRKLYAESQPLTERRKRSIEIKELAERGLKRCTNCDEIKPMTTDYFYPYNKSKYPPKDGLQYHCIDCQSNTYQENRESNGRSARKWVKNNPIKRRLILSKYKQNRRARKRNLPDTLTQAEIAQMLDYFDHKCAACGTPQDMFIKLELDHWIPLSSDDCPGTTALNIVPLCGGSELDSHVGCNQSKSNKDPYEWLVWRFGEAEANDIYQRIMAYFISI